MGKFSKENNEERLKRIEAKEKEEQERIAMLMGNGSVEPGFFNSLPYDGSGLSPKKLKEASNVQKLDPQIEPVGNDIPLDKDPTINKSPK